MHVNPVLRPLLVFILAACCALAFAQPQKAPGPYVPSEGQEGKDVVWIPTSQALVDKMLDMAKVTPRDFLMDLGSGDGRTVITAAKRGARAMGIEYNPDMVALAQRNAEKEGVSGRATFMKADLFETDFSKATVITMFLLPEINKKLRPRLLQLKPGTRVVSNTFTMAEWQADETVNLTESEGCTASWCTALLWLVPARIAGTYSIPDGQLVLKQEFQKLSGTLRAAYGPVPVEGRVRGEEISFTAGGREYHGRRNGKQLELR